VERAELRHGLRASDRRQDTAILINKRPTLIVVQSLIDEIFDLKRLREYLSDLYGSEIELKHFGELGKEKDTLTEPGMASAKEFGYGRPYLVEFEAKGKRVSLVLETMRSNIFGHEFAYDRAQSLLMAHSLFNRLPKHARSIDVGMFMKDANLKSAGNYDEFFILSLCSF
jgi:hypothetical protein